MPTNSRLSGYVELFLELYDYALKNPDRDFQSIVNSILSKQGFQFHLSFVGVFDNGFVRKYKIDSPAVSLGFTFVIPVGPILFHKDFKRLPKDWVEFVVAHELGHICLNHFPINIFVHEIWKSLPQDLRESWVGLKWLLYLLSTLSGQSYKFPEDEITAQKELLADEWAAKTIGRKEPALSFFKWIKEQGMIISHLSPIGGLPALKIDERIKHIENLLI